MGVWYFFFTTMTLFFEALDGRMLIFLYYYAIVLRGIRWAYVTLSLLL